jgi:surfactin synthase thioesterase subunit
VRTRVVSPFVRPRPVDDPEVRLVVFHHAGGSAAAYYPMVQHVPPTWDLLLLELPGRGQRHAEPVLTDVPALVEQAVAATRPWMDVPIVLFGHSLGAILAAEVGRSLEREGRPPHWVGVSARIAPVHQARYRARLHELDDRSLLRELETMGGISDRIREFPEFLARFLATVRGDLLAVDSWVPHDRRARLSCALGAFAGIDDPWAPMELMQDWAAETTAEVVHRRFGGGHFYFLEDGFATVTAELVSCVRVHLRTQPARDIPASSAAGAGLEPPR